MAALSKGDFERVQPPGRTLAVAARSHHAYFDVNDKLVSPAGSAAAEDLDMNGDAVPPAKAKFPLMWGFALAVGTALPFRLSSAAALPAGETSLSSAGGNNLAMR